MVGKGDSTNQKMKWMMMTEWQEQENRPRASIFPAAIPFYQAPIASGEATGGDYNVGDLSRTAWHENPKQEGLMMKRPGLCQTKLEKIFKPWLEQLSQ